MRSAPKPPNPNKKTRLPGQPVQPTLRQPPVAPPAYRPQPVPRVLQTKTAATQQPRAVLKPPQAPPVYRPQPSRVQAKLTGPTHKTNPMLKGIIQQHPMLITIEGGNSIRMDTDHFQSYEDVTRHLPPGSANQLVTSINIRKESRGDHQYVIVTTFGGINLKMHLGTAGAEIKCGREISAEFGIGRGRYQPASNLTMADVIGTFYNTAHAHAFESDTYNCSRFAADLAGSLGTLIREKGDDLDGFF